MKPVRLTLQAFGPYPGRQVVDFRDAVEAGLFGIYGQTGSGKSTLFSAMTFALFGQPAKTDQEAVSLRSDHAAADLLTEVEFVFEVGGRQYVAVRSPEQMRPSRRGGGETRNAHEAHLFDATGLAVEDITPDQRGKVIAEKKVGLVDAAIVERLGYGAEQFRQIVLLPQGRFETFLTAKTKERGDILRDLFDVSLYRRLTESLKERADSAERQVQRERAVYEQRLRAEGFETDADLSAGISGAEEDLVIRRQALGEAREIANASWAAVRSAELTEARFVEAERAAQAVATLEARADAMETLALRLERTRQAQTLTDVEAAVLKASAERKQTEGAISGLRTGADLAEQGLREAEARWAAEQGREAEIAAIRRHAEDLERHRTTLGQAAEVLTALTAAQAADAEARHCLQDAQKTLDRLRTEQDRQTEALRQARRIEEQRQRLTAQRVAEQHRLARAKDYAVAERDVQRAAQQAEACQQARNQAVEAWATAQQALEQAERAVAHSHAVSLASRLTAGDPCPVCGGRDHPAPAIGTVEAGDLMAVLSAAEADGQAADRAMRQSEERLSAVRSVLTEREARLAGLEPPEQALGDLQAAVDQLDADLKALGPVTDLVAAEAAAERRATAIAQGEEERDRLRDALRGCEVAVASLITKRDVLLETVPDVVRDPAGLAQALAVAQKRLQMAMQARQQAEEAVQRARDTALAAIKDLQAGQDRLEERRRREKDASAVFIERLEQAELTAEAYRSLKPGFARLAEDREAVEAYRRDRAAAGTVFQQAEAAVQGVTRPDLTVLKAQAAEAAATVQRVETQEIEAGQRLGTLLRLQERLAEAKQALEAVEAESAPLRGLAAAVSGNNPHKLTLEIYAIAAMFEAVLQSANLRLGPMTGHRYQLVRDAEGSGRAQRGLGIQVADSHTGKERPTATLSGGETFIAALALALGLADVVESTSGRVQLETIFIDEGFGSLDTEHGTGTLDQVLQVLNTLVSQNRAVGLISHVPLVQEAIPNGFYIRKQAGGSQVETRGRG